MSSVQDHALTLPPCRAKVIAYAPGPPLPSGMRPGFCFSAFPAAVPLRLQLAHGAVTACGAWRSVPRPVATAGCGPSAPDDVAGHSRRSTATMPRGRPRAGPHQQLARAPRRWGSIQLAPASSPSTETSVLTVVIDGPHPARRRSSLRPEHLHWPPILRLPPATPHRSRRQAEATRPPAVGMPWWSHGPPSTPVIVRGHLAAARPRAHAWPLFWQRATPRESDPFALRRPPGIFLRATARGP